jgi:regulator of cell morphogenesis and NO signaling
MEITENLLNVTLLEPRQKHPAIFRRFDQLSPGESFIIQNDHDPKPLYYQLLGERGNTFNWEYLEQGPEWWKVRICKRQEGPCEETLGALAARDLRKAQVFKAYGLDFCCGGKKTVKEACAEKGLDVTQVEQALQAADKLSSLRPLPYDDWSLDFLADYIVNTHHSYVRKTLPEIMAYAGKVMKVHGGQHPELVTIHYLVQQIDAELTDHLKKEELVLFPVIRQLVVAKSNTSPSEGTCIPPVQNTISLMEAEHEIAGKNLAAIRELSENYSLPEDACASYSLLYRMLQEFEEDLHLHIHLENNILFPKALETEKQFRAARNAQ